MTHAKVTQYIKDKIRHVEHNSTVHSRIISSLDELKTSGYDFKKDQKQIVQTIIHGTESASIINKLFSLNIDHEHALKLSVEAKNKTAVKALIDKGVNLSYQDPATGKTPLHIAIEKQNPDIVEYILDSKKNKFWY